MTRTKKLVVRLDKSELAAVERLAEAERLPASTLARRMLLIEAERTAERGVVPSSPASTAQRAGGAAGGAG